MPSGTISVLGLSRCHVRLWSGHFLTDSFADIRYNQMRKQLREIIPDIIRLVQPSQLPGSWKHSMAVVLEDFDQDSDRWNSVDSVIDRLLAEQLFPPLTRVP